MESDPGCSVHGRLGEDPALGSWDPGTGLSHRKGFAVPHGRPKYDSSCKVNQGLVRDFQS